MVSMVEKIEPTSRYNYHFDGDLCLKEIDVLGEVQCVLATVSDHVRIQDVVGAFEHVHEMCQINGALQRKLK